MRLRGTVYIEGLGTDGALRMRREVYTIDDCESDDDFQGAVMRQVGPGSNLALEFGPIGEPWRRL